MSLLCFGKHVLPKALGYPGRAINQYSRHETVRQALESIPEGVQVAASTRYTTYLSQRDVLYDLRYCLREHLLEAEYIALDLTSRDDYDLYATPGQQDGLEKLLQLLQENGYREYLSAEETLIYCK